MSDISQGQEISNLENPITPEQIKELDDAIELGNAVQPLIQRAQAAGIDLGALPDQINASVQRARQIKQVFDPGTS